MEVIGYPLIDLHTHILPGMDDGAADLEQALAMARTAADDGITIIAATPHVLAGEYDNSRVQILQKIGELQQVLEAEGINIKIMPGAEYYIEADLPRRLADGQLLTINDGGKYLLVELPAMMVPDYTARVLYELQLQGVTPILAHPERNSGFARDPKLLQVFIERGFLVQITAGSITGKFGKAVSKTAMAFLQNGCVHIIASDAHSASKHNPRIPVLSPACAILQRKYGTDMARQLSSGNPEKILAGQRPEMIMLDKNNKGFWPPIKRNSVK